VSSNLTPSASLVERALEPTDENAW